MVALNPQSVKLRKIIMDDNIDVWLKVTPILAQEMTHENHHILKTMNSQLKKILLQGYGILLDKKIVLKWLTGDLDKNNTYCFDKGDIFVTFKNSKIENGVSRQTIDIKKYILGEK